MNQTVVPVVAASNLYYASSSVADHSVVAPRSLAGLCDAIGTNQATIVLRHSRNSEKTEYLIGANLDLSAYTNITFQFERGAVLSHEAFTLNIPNIEAGRYQIFSGTGTVTLSGTVYPEWFGAVGDGVTDDTLGFMKALEAVGDGYEVLLRPVGYVLNKSSVPVGKLILTFYIKGGSMRGDGKATIYVNGELGFDTSSRSIFSCKNCDFILMDCFYGPDDSHNGLPYVFSNVSNASKTNCTYKNLTFTADVVTADGTARAWTAVGERNIERGIFESIETNNIARALVITDSSNFKIRDILSQNVETQLYVVESSHYSVENITLINTVEQSGTWVNKTGVSARSKNGCDLFLSEGGSDYSLFNLVSYNAIERCVYSQGDNVIASHLKSVNSDGFKFVGTSDHTIENISVNNLEFVVDEDLASVGKTNLACYTSYYASNILVSNIKITNNGFGSCARAINLMLKNTNITIDHVTADYLLDCLCYVTLSSETYDDISDYVVVDNLTIKHCHITKPTNIGGGFPLLSQRTVDASAGALLNYGMKNVRIIDNTVEYLTFTDMQNFFYNWSRIDGFYASGNKSNGRWRDASGLPMTAFPVTNNIVLLEEGIISTNIALTLLRMKTVTSSNQTRLRFVSYPTSQTTILLNAEIVQGSGTPMTIYENSIKTMTIVINGEYVSITNLSAVYTIELISTDGYYLGIVDDDTRTDIVSTSPVTITHTSGRCVIRGETYAGKATVTIKMCL